MLRAAQPFGVPAFEPFTFTSFSSDSMATYRLAAQKLSASFHAFHEEAIAHPSYEA
jgi:hypothetical protein